MLVLKYQIISFTKLLNECGMSEENPIFVSVNILTKSFYHSQQNF
jgi:hypothetical protein